MEHTKTFVTGAEARIILDMGGAVALHRTDDGWAAVFRRRPGDSESWQLITRRGQLRIFKTADAAVNHMQEMGAVWVTFCTDIPF